ncbi:unnamed protein product [Paramecium primaurelia]|uniref:Cyclic nucleotide-binding domain-containing protein n=1 Tax=Paramecium primaurelia TaxID=5886 RepID=A0A8S1LVA1_PARPR|nr:unnamed protein product [Paramecium primaurelia]
MISRDTGFQDLESGIQSNNLSSGQLVDLDQNSPINGQQLDPTLEFSQLQQLEALRMKRDIFDNKHKQALNLGNKSDINEEDCLISNFSGKRSEPQGSISSISCNLKKQKPITSKPTKQRSNKTIQFQQKLEQDDFVIGSPKNQSGTNILGIKSDAKIVKYQTFVQQLEEEQEQNEKQKRAQMHHDTLKQQSLVLRGKSREMKTGLNEVWSQKALIIIRLVSRFIQQLKTKTERIKFRLITQRIFEVICDNSANFEYMLINRLIKQKPSLGLVIFHHFSSRALTILNTIEYINDFLSKYIKVIKPDSLFKIVWDIILLLFIVVNIFYIPIYISFDVRSSGLFEWIFDLLPSWVFIAEILLNFNTAYYDKGLMHEDRKQIMKHYVKGNFFWDIIVVIPFLISYLDIPFVRYTLLLRLTRLSPLMTSIEEVLNLEDSLQIVLDLLKLIFFLLLTGHFCGCAWHWVAIIEYQDYGQELTWLTRYEPNAMNYEWFDRYIISLYWSVITTVTVGYGDIVPVTTVERVFVIVVTLLICGVFGYCLSNIGNIFKQITDKKAVYKQRIREINQHIRKRGLSYNLQLKVKKYFEYFLKVKQEEDQHAEQFIEQLTKHLREEVLTDIYSKTLKQSRFLRENFSEEILNRLCQIVKETKLYPEQVLFQRNDSPKALWFVLSGAVEYVADHQNEDEHYYTETFLKKLTQGAVIGEREFISQTPYEYNARATKFTQLLVVDYQQFYLILQENNDEFEKYCLAKDNLLFNSNYKAFGQICEICGWTHRFIQCPFVFLQPNKNKIASSFVSTKTNKRLSFPYRTLAKSNWRNNMPEVQEAALGYIVLNNIIPEKEINDNYLVNLGFELNERDEEPSKIIPNKKNSMSKDPKLLSQYDNTPQQQPIQQPSIQTVLQDQKSQNQTAIFHKDGQKVNLTNESIIDWDQGSQLRRSMNRIKFQGLDRGRTLQSIKGKQHHQNNGGGVDILEESMIEEELKIQNTNIGSQKFIHSKLKMVKSKHNNQNPIGIRKVSWLEFDSGPLQHQDGKAAQQLFNKQISKGSETNFDQSPPINQQENDIKQRIEARENSIISKKTNNNIDITRRKKRRKTTQLLQFFQGMDNGDTKSTKRVEKSILGNDVYSSSVYTTGGPSNTALIDSNNKDNNNADNNSVHVAHSFDGIQKRIQDIVHVHFEMDLDRYKSSKFYFPDYNVEVVLQKISVYYDKVNDKKFDMREMKRTKTNLTLFDRIRQAKNPTIRGSFVDKSLQDND